MLWIGLLLLVLNDSMNINLMCVFQFMLCVVYLVEMGWGEEERCNNSVLPYERFLASLDVDTAGYSRFMDGWVSMFLQGC